MQGDDVEGIVVCYGPLTRQECVVAVAATVGKAFGDEVGGGRGDGGVVFIEDEGDVGVVLCDVGDVVGVDEKVVAACYPV